jgi:arylsulfatase A-like enzyme
VEGKSLLTMISGKEDETSGRQNYAYAQTPYRNAFFFKAKELQSLRTNQWKFIYDVKTGQHELYNLTNDPEEQDDLSSIRSLLLNDFQSALLKLNDDFQWTAWQPERIEIDEGTEEKLKSLGYIK